MQNDDVSYDASKEKSEEKPKKKTNTVRIYKVQGTKKRLVEEIPLKVCFTQALVPT